ncbi:MAG: alanine dehydrogenase [Pseudomonadota bacterium]
MLIGVPKEIKNHEYRVGLTPESVIELVNDGNRVDIETGAGAGIDAHDDLYHAAGATIVGSSDEIFHHADMIVKVKEPQPSERARLRPGQVLFTYLHLAPDPDQARDLVKSGAICIAYETVTGEGGSLPLLKPMSQVAGRLAIQVGAASLQNNAGGRGVLLGGVPGIAPAKVIIIGGGDVGFNAAQMAVGLQADVTIFEQDAAVMERLSVHFGPSAKILRSTHTALSDCLKTADLVVGAVLVPGAAAPKILSRAMIKTMRRGSVLVDVAIDQGGCFETSRPTTHDNPLFEVDGVVHYCVANMPGAVSRSSTYALNAATLQHTKNIAKNGWRAAMEADAHLLNGLNVAGGRITHQAVGEALGVEAMDPTRCL